MTSQGLAILFYVGPPYFVVVALLLLSIICCSDIDTSIRVLLIGIASARKPLENPTTTTTYSSQS